MDEQVWCGLDLQLQDEADDPFWPALADCTASFLAAGDDIDITGSAGTSDKVAEDDMALDVDTGRFVAVDEQHDRLITMHQQEQIMYSPLSSNKRCLSIDSAGTASSPFSFDALMAFSAPAAPPHDPSAVDDAAIMRAMMAVLSSASPSSSESSSPPRCHGSGSAQQAAVYPRGGNDNNDGHVDVVVRSTSLAVAPETNTAASLDNSGWPQQQENGAVPGSSSSSSSQVYHMMSERKRREKLNDSFQTLRSLLPPCSKKDKTTVLINATSYLKKLEEEVSELEEKNAKLERHIPPEDGGAAATTWAAQAAAHRRAKVQISRAPSDADQVNLTVMVMVECDIVDLVLHVLESLKWMAGVSVLSVDADTYSPQVLLKAIASIKLQITDGDCWDEASFHEAMKVVVHDATSPCSSAAQLVAAA